MPHDAEHTSIKRLRLRNLTRDDGSVQFAEDVRRGLTAEPERLLPKYFYDDLGSILFDAICLLPEYYLTRAENEIFERHANEIVSVFSGYHRQGRRGGSREPQGRSVPEDLSSISLLEMGSGSAMKTRRIIEALLKRQPTLLYTPIDISTSALATSSRLLLDAYPGLQITAYASDYHTALVRLREERETGGPMLVLFLGSNIGNFEREEAQGFLRALRGVLRPNDALLLGADLKKDRAVLEAAYDDALGVTAAFNLNQLVRINHELGADFDLHAYKHIAFYNEEMSRIEVYIESICEQNVHVRDLDLKVTFAAGERIHTEHSHKYAEAEISQLAREAGFTVRQSWFDGEHKFSSSLLLAGA